MRAVHWFKKLLLAAVLGLLLIVSAGLAAAQFYLNRPAMTEKIRAVFAQKFGGELTFQNLRLNLFTGLTAEQLQLRPAAAAPFLAIQRVELRYSPLALLRKKIKVNRIDLLRPELNFIRQGDAWLLPQPRDNFVKQALTLSTGHNTFVIILDDITLRDATVSVTAADRELFRAGGLNLSGELKNREGAGALDIRDLRLGATLTLGEVRAALAYANDEITIAKLRATAYGGAADGDLKIPTTAEKENPHYGVYLNFRNIAFPLLLQDLNADPGLLNASGDLECHLWGDLRHPELFQGKGYFTAKQASLTGIRALDLIGNLLTRPALRDTVFDTVSGSFKIADDQLTFYALELISPDLKISASGAVQRDQTLNLDVLLTVTPALLAQLPPPAAAQFSTQPDGTKSIAFKITGTPEAPVCNLSDKLYGKPPEL